MQKQRGGARERCSKLPALPTNNTRSPTCIQAISNNIGKPIAPASKRSSFPLPPFLNTA